MAIDIQTLCENMNAAARFSVCMAVGKFGPTRGPTSRGLNRKVAREKFNRQNSSGLSSQGNELNR